MNIKFKYQKGMTLMELLVAGSISIIASTGMIVLMASTLGAGTQVIKMTGLSQDMRTSMQLMTRELRRANYHSTYAVCFGDVDCRNTLGLTGVVKAVTIDGGSPGSCFYFWYDRPQASGVTPVEVTGEQVAAFRRKTDSNGVGIIEMSVSETDTPDCSCGQGEDDNSACADDRWQPITDPKIYDITSLVVTNDLSFAIPVNSTGANLAVDRIGITMIGGLIGDANMPTWLQGGNAPSVTLQDFVRVRNDISSPL